MLLRVRSRTGTARIDAVDGWTKAELWSAVSDATGIASQRLKVLCGYPPMPLDLPDGQPIAETLRAGEMLVVEEVAPAPEEKKKEEETAVAAAVTFIPERRPSSAGGAAAVPMHTDGAAAAATAAAASSPSIAAEADFLRRVVPDDNSCLFRAVSYVLGIDTAPEVLRSVIAEEVGKRPEYYTEGMLGRTNGAYRAWIQTDTAWGGAVELAILSAYYKVELAAFDVKTERMDCYGQGQGWELRGFLLYDGIHYDPLALALGGEAARDMDVTLFPPQDRVAEGKARGVAARAKAQRAYTDTQNFRLKCNDCGTIIYGERAATEHAKTFSHTNFVEA